MFRENSGIGIFLPKKILIWGIVVSFTIFQLFLEMLTNTMVPSFIALFKINHTGVGILSSAFFYSFLLMQIPAGIILDRFNIQWVLAIACAGCGIGCLWFGHSTSLEEAIISRFVMGGFAAFGFLGLLKISIIWYSVKNFPFLIGFSQFLVMIITAFGEPIVSHYVNRYGFQLVLNDMGYIAFLIAIFIVLFVRHRRKIDKFKEKYYGITHSLGIAFRSKQYWLASIFSFGMFSTVTSFSALWGLTYLTKIYHLKKYEAAFGISINFSGVALGCIFFGFLASRLKNYQILLWSGSLLALLVTLVLAYTFNLTVIQLYTFLFLLGFFSGVYFLCFDIIEKSLTPYSDTVATSFCNIIVMSSTLLLQPFIGFLIDCFGNYQSSMMVLVCTLSISFILSHFIKINQIVLS